MTNTENQTESLVKEFQAAFCPYGYMDIESAVEHATESGHSVTWAVEQIEEFCDSTDTKADDCDPVYIVLDSILQEARTEIEELTGWDMLNDAKNSIDTYGNFMCSSYDYKEEAITEFKKILKKNKVNILTLSTNTQYFLSECDITN